MSILPSRRFRRRSLIPVGRPALSEGVLITEDGHTTLEISGGPPFAVVELFAAQLSLGSVALDQLGFGSFTLTECDLAHIEGPIELRHGPCPLLTGRRDTLATPSEGHQR